MGKIIAVVNQKGGVGKTTTCINLAAGLAYLGKRILLVDFDPQGSATQGVGCAIGLKDETVYDALHSGDPANALKKLSIPPLDILPTNISLVGAEPELVRTETDREKKLKGLLDPLRPRYDFILIDCPPSLGLLNTNALTAADSVIIPVQCEYLALEGVTLLLQTIRLVQKLYNPALRIEGVLLTMYDARTNLGAEVVEEVRRYFQEKVYETIIPRNIRLSEAPSHGLSIIDYDPRSKGAEVYQTLAKEVLAREE